MSSLQLDTGKESPSIAIHFTIQNKDEEKMLPSLHMEFAQSFDMKLIENDNDTTNVASATEHFELQANENVECVAHFEVLGNARQGLCLRGDLFYDIEVIYIYIFAILRRKLKKRFLHFIFCTCNRVRLWLINTLLKFLFL